MDIRYIVIAETGSWGAGRTLRAACRRACLIEQTRGAHFEYSISPEEFAENWRSWQDWGRHEYAEPDLEPVRVVIYPLDLDEWSDWAICGITGALSAIPADKSVSVSAASKRLREICIKAEWINGAIKPTPAA